MLSPDTATFYSRLAMLNNEIRQTKVQIKNLQGKRGRADRVAKLQDHLDYLHDMQNDLWVDAYDW